MGALSNPFQGFHRDYTTRPGPGQAKTILYAEDLMAPSIHADRKITRALGVPSPIQGCVEVWPLSPEFVEAVIEGHKFSFTYVS
jgi:hypothetical protein